jgi:uncharacterized protein (TIGR00251 family)
MQLFGSEGHHYELWTSMINYTDKDGKLIFKVRVVPRASRSELVGEHDGALRVRIAAPPVDGAANDELVRLLAQAFGVPRSAIDITGGHAAKLKTVCVTGGRAALLKSKVQSPMSNAQGSRASGSK